MREITTRKPVLIISREALENIRGLSLYVPRKTTCIVKGTVAIPQLVYVSGRFIATIAANNHVESARSRLFFTQDKYFIAAELLSEVDIEKQEQEWTIQVFPQELEAASWYYLSTAGAI